jgi:hypothetical protein
MVVFLLSNAHPPGRGEGKGERFSSQREWLE